MLTSVNPLERVAVGRLLEFLSDRMPWHRSLWGIGIVLAMDELFEACEAMRQGHLSEGSVKRIATSLQRRVGVHPAFSESEKAFLRDQVRQVPRADSAAHFGIRELSLRAAKGHGARLDSVALTASLRTVSKLAGAGMDRITHGHYVQQLKPLELVAKANLAISLASREDPLGCVDLLEIA